MNKNKNVTISPYWFYKPSNKSNFNLINKIKLLIENFFKIKIVKSKNFNNSFEKSSFLKSKNLVLLRNKYLIKELGNFLKKLKIKTNNNYLNQLINKHDNIFYNNHIIKNNYGGMGYNSSLFLYVFINHLEIDLICESGVWKGYTTFLFDNYKRKNIKKISFDIDFSNKEYHSKKTLYFEYDLSKYDISKLKKYNKKFVFFDDHVSQYDRLLFSKKNKFKYIVFDDDIELTSVHSDGWPSIPTIAMISSKTNIKNFAWQSILKQGKANVDIKKMKYILKDYIYVKSHNISHITGYYNQPQMGFLIKK